MRPPEELLYDSEASLRLVDHAIEELNETGTPLDHDAKHFLEHVANQPGGFAELSRTLLRAYAETVGIVARIRDSCGMIGADEGGDRLLQMHGRLRDVSTATETATTGILDSVSRANTLADQLETANDADRKRMIAELKDELSGLTTHLQFQDITAQQLSHLGSLLSDMRQRLAQIVSVFIAPKEPGGRATPPISQEALPELGAFDPTASAVLSPTGQAVADEIFAVRGDRKKTA